ncbi:hypothetical protein ACH5RR_005582 [Cinchona calisaya]|uniref:Protein FAR1-RELATED SEQUENCE n=1 Tax=Cinchona calisaya TaxID=153742 RepID=A0ABD3ALM7_9GENT
MSSPSSPLQEFDIGHISKVLEYEFDKEAPMEHDQFDNDMHPPIFEESRMSTTQRNESMNKFFKDYLNSSTPMSKFVVQYDKAIEARHALMVLIKKKIHSLPPLYMLNRWRMNATSGRVDEVPTEEFQQMQFSTLSTLWFNDIMVRSLGLAFQKERHHIIIIHVTQVSPPEPRIVKTNDLAIFGFFVALGHNLFFLQMVLIPLIKLLKDSVRFLIGGEVCYIILSSHQFCAKGQTSFLLSWKQ